MTVKQLSVFIENRKGRLGEVLSVLKAHKVNILSMCVADTTEYGLLRLIVNDPEKGKDALLADGFSSMVSDVLIIKLPHHSGSLSEVLEVIADKNINIDYMYGLSVDGADASVVMKTADIEAAKQALTEGGIATMTAEELTKL